MFNLQEILDISINKEIGIEDSVSQIGALSGSNALLFDGVNFEAEDSSHCPRVALLRRVFGFQEKRQIPTYLSNSHGRRFEDQIRDLLERHSDYDFVIEEQAQITITNENNEPVLTARPDLVFDLKEQNTVYPVDIKTVQSNSTAYNIMIKGIPKLAACIQVCIYLWGLKASKGAILYAIANWFSGYAGKTSWKVTPQLKVFECELTNGIFYYNNTESTITVDKLEAGIVEFLRCAKTYTLPTRPLWVDIRGDIAKYNGCSLCPFKNVCDKFDAEHNINLNQFYEEVKFCESV